MSESKKKYLQPTREGAMPTLIERYKGLVDGIFDAVGGELPEFKDIVEDEDDPNPEIIKTSEQQLFAFIKNRKDALAVANEMLNTINVIERERDNPEEFHTAQEEKEGVVETTVTKVHPSKRHSKTS